MSTRQYRFSPPEGNEAKRAPLRLCYITQTRYSAEWNCTLHTHACAEVFFVTGGHGYFHVQDRAFPAAVNDVIIVNAGVPHTETSQTEYPLEYTAMGVDGLELLTDTDGFTMLHLYGGGEDLTVLLRIMLKEAEDSREGHYQVCQNLLEVILLQLERRNEFPLPVVSSGSRASRECDLVRRYIDNHFKENLGLDELSELAHINKYYLAHVFRKEFNTSPISYLKARRIQESRYLLSDTDHTLSHIAHTLGFSSLSYFSQSFRRLEGMSPMEYRKRHRDKSSNRQRV